MSSTPPRWTDETDETDDAIDFAPLVALAARVTNDLPSGSPTGWRRITFRTVLSAISRDRVENDTGQLEEGDLTSLGGFVQLAARAASTAPLEYRDDAYEVLLHALLEDWVENWVGSDSDDEDDE